jgi:hypothetical protein
LVVGCAYAEGAMTLDRVFKEEAYIVHWSSTGNIDKGTVVVTAKSISEAQDKFLGWLREQPVYQHMWNLTFSIEEGKLI